MSKIDIVGAISMDKKVSRIATVIIIFTVLLSLLTLVLPQYETAGDTLNATGAPLASFFQSGGLIILMIMGFLTLTAIGAFGMWRNKR